MKPIETYYKGYRFRSRLEARWAVFFDAAGFKYRYETEGFVLSDGTYYIPDFWLPEQRLWVEVKGDLDEESKRKIELFSEQLDWKDSKLWVLRDVPDVSTYRWRFDLEEDAFWVYAKDAADGPYLPCVCPACGKLGVEFDGRGWRICGVHSREPMYYPEAANKSSGDKGYSFDAPILMAAYRKARQARFEHGEKPNF